VLAELQKIEKKLDELSKEMKKQAAEGVDYRKRVKETGRKSYRPRIREKGTTRGACKFTPNAFAKIEKWETRTQGLVLVKFYFHKLSFSFH
jgi:predicted  nucleic acid-binding Zn-ribbon protein